MVLFLEGERLENDEGVAGHTLSLQIFNLLLEALCTIMFESDEENEHHEEILG